MKEITATIFILLLTGGSSWAVTMGESPVGEAMLASPASGTWPEQLSQEYVTGRCPHLPEIVMHSMGKNSVNEAMRASLAAETLSRRVYASAASDEFAPPGQESVSSDKKSVFKAAMYSALVPGGGQYYLGHHRTARYFFTAEALTWLGYLSFQMYGDWKKNDYIDYAATHANARLEGKSDDFLTWVSFYNNIREFNALGRAWDNERPYLQDTPDNHWEWQSTEDRQTFRDLRNRSREAYRRSDFMIGVAVIDRVISIIDAVRSTRRINRRIGGGDFSAANGALEFSVDPLSSRRQLCLKFYPGF